MRAALASLAIVTLAACGGSSDDPGTAAKASGNPSSAPASSAPASSAPPAASLSLAGKWKLSVVDLRRTFGTAEYAKASLAVSGTRVKVVGTTSFSSEFYIPNGKILELECRSDGGFGQAGPAEACREEQPEQGYLAEGSGYRVVNGFTFEPYPIETGPDVCGAPAVPGIRMITDLTATTFSYKDGRSHQTNGACYQVLWTVKAVRVA